MNIVDAIRRFNAGRDPERLAMKYRNLRASPSLFLRGTCHLFYARLPKEKILAASPAAWLSGDLHFENFGSYKGANRLVYFDINDFDEAVLAPAAWDILRLLTSVLVARRTLHLKRGQADRLCEQVIDAYGAALATGKAGWIDRDTADGPVQQLLAGLKERKTRAFVARRTTMRGRMRTIRCDGEHALAATDDQKRQVASLIDKAAVDIEHPEFFKVLDAARRIAGTGSLGVERYVVLVEGNGSPDGNHLLDLKLAPRSSLDGVSRLKQPVWPSHAHRVVELHQRLQAVAPAFLRHIVAGKASYVLRELQPSEDRLTLAEQGAATDNVLRQMGQLAAWAQLRSSGRQGSASADDLIAFGAARSRWSGDLMRAARLCAEQVDKDWRTWCLAYDKNPAWARSPKGPALKA